MSDNKKDMEKEFREKYKDIDIIIDDSKGVGMTREEIDKMTAESLKNPKLQKLFKTLK